VEQPLAAWAGADYAANTAHHRTYDAWFLEAVPLLPTDRLLDVGCGSGDFTADLAALVPEGHVLGIDAQPSMIAEARKRARPNQSFAEVTAQRLAEVAEPASFDGVVSRAVLHWVPATEHAGVWRSIARALRPGGWVRVDAGGAGNIPRVRPLLDEVAAEFGGPAAPWSFEDAGATMERVEAAGLVVPEWGWVRTVAQHRRFDREALVGWLQSQTLNAYEARMPASSHAAFRAAALARVDELRRADGSYDQTFVRLDVLAARP
jgi:trans-aconitate methyltransferase